MPSQRRAVPSLRRAVPPTAGHFTSLLGVGAGLVGLGGGRRVPARIYSLRSGRVSLPAWGGSTSVWGRAAGKFFVSPFPALGRVSPCVGRSTVRFCVVPPHCVRRVNLRVGAGVGRLALPSQRRAVPPCGGSVHLRTAGCGRACGTCRSGGLSRRWLRRFCGFRPFFLIKRRMNKKAAPQARAGRSRHNLRTRHFHGTVDMKERKSHKRRRRLAL